MMRRLLLVMVVAGWLGVFGVSPVQAIYVDNGDTVTDTATGLEWQQATAGSMNWDTAMQYGDNMTLNGKSDWRLPTIEELRTLVKTGSSPAIDTDFFPDTYAAGYWSSTTLPDSPDYAWRILFTGGIDGANIKTYSYYVRCVRGGQSESLRNLVISRPGPGSGSVASSPAGITCGSDCAETYHYNNTITLTATPNPDSTFTGWSGDADCADGVVTMTTDVACTATFAVSTQILTYIAGAHCTISGVSLQTVIYGGSGTAVTAVPTTGYHFEKWSDDSTANPRTDSNVTGDISVTAVFALNTYTLSYSTGASGMINGTTLQTVNHGSSGTAVTAVPASGYSFVTWSDDSTANPRTDSNVTGDISVTATFTVNSYTVTSSAGANGAISPLGPQTLTHGNAATFAVTPDPGYTASVGGTCGGILVGDTYITNFITDDCTISALFYLNAHVVTSGAGAHGTISPVGTQAVIDGHIATFTVIPEPGYTTAVSGTCGGELVGATYTTSAVTAACTVVASFSQDSHTLTYLAGPHGVITGDTPQAVSYGSSGTTVTAVPDAGYHFLRWSDGSLANPRTDANVTVDISVIAVFNKKFPWSLWVPAMINGARLHGAAVTPPTE